MHIYQELQQKHEKQLQQLNTKYNYVSLLRFLCVAALVFAFYMNYKTAQPAWLILFTIAGIAFFSLMRIHQKMAYQIKLKKALSEINQNESDFLNGTSIPFEDGGSFETHDHFYTYDLDIFGAHGLYQHLNRTATYIGGKTLAELLQDKLDNKNIIENQQAIQELSARLDWRQQLYATSRLLEDKKTVYDKLISWSKTDSKPISFLYVIIAVALTLFLTGLILTTIITANQLYLNISLLVFLLNIGVVYSLQKKIRSEIVYFDGIDKITKQYGAIIHLIETENFDSNKLIHLKNELSGSGKSVSIAIQELGSLIAAMDAIQNLVVAILFNGFFLFHIHVLHRLLKWKKQHAQHIKKWLSVVGEFETLNSLANFSYNNPYYCFPKLNDDYAIEMNHSGHPLLKQSVRVNNSVSFKQHPFIILTGSNMSGKSTFLRSLGVNMVLCNIGSCICAQEANIHPLPILVSMRLSDSLSENESYFFAEVKRLKQIMLAQQQNRAFVLLDEILRGTNSDDKRNGTIGVIKKLIEKQAIGAIATHDLEICKTTFSYPNYLSNCCFEVEIIDNQLEFDYHLRPGICQNQSASFLMEKMEII